MKTFLKKSGLGLLLYCLLGVVLSIAGVSVVDKPVEFCIILGLVIAIDVSSFKKALQGY